MATVSQQLRFRNSIIHYTRWGSGPEWLFCFHGYGEDSSSFRFLEKTLEEQYTVIAIDLPFHGRTQWREGLSFEPAELLNIIHQIRPQGQGFHLLGYSMGGRVSLQLLQLAPNDIKSVLLVAPDGLHKKIWQRLATGTRLGKRIFTQVMNRPEWLLAALDGAATLGLYNRNLLKFVHHYLDDAPQRELLYQRWLTLRRFKPDRKLAKKIIRQNRIPVQLVFGRYDPVILTRYGTAFCQKTSGLVSLTELEAGHQLLREKYAADIARFLVK